MRLLTDMSSADAQVVLGCKKTPSDSVLDEIQRLKIELITQAGRLDFAEADAKIRLAQIRVQKAENEKLAVQISQLETRLGIFLAGKDNEGQ